mgnify:CR=1 FL=1
MILWQVMHAFDGEAEGELYLSVGDIVVVRQVHFLISIYIWMILVAWYLEICVLSPCLHLFNSETPEQFAISRIGFIFFIFVKYERKSECEYTPLTTLPLWMLYKSIVILFSEML